MTVAAMGTQQRYSIQTSSVTSRQHSLGPFDDTTLGVLPCLQDRRVMPVHSIIHAQAACFGRLYTKSSAPLSHIQGSPSCCALIVFMVDNIKLIPGAGVYLNGILAHLHAALRSRVLLLNIFIPIGRPCSDNVSHLRP